MKARIRAFGGAPIPAEKERDAVMYIIIEDDDRRRRKYQVLQEYACETPSREQEEYADCGAARIQEAALRMRRHDYRKTEGRFDDLKLAVENLSGGANTVLLDDIGMPSIMVGLPKMRVCDLCGGDDTSIHPAWMFDCEVKEVIYVSKYMNCVADGRAYSLPMRDPHTHFTFDDANRFSQNKGRGWHLTTNAIWAAIALWCKRNGTVPRGNTGWGYSHLAPHEKGIPTAMLGSEVMRTASGSGPVTWNHNHNESGISDLVGNMFEWVGGLRLMDGEIQLIPQGVAMRYDEDAWTKDSRRWLPVTTEGGYAAHGETNTLKIDSLTPGDAEERDHLLGVPFVSGEIRNRSYTGPHKDGNQGFLDCFFSDLKMAEGLKPPKLLQLLGVIPDENCTREHGIFVARNYGERIAVRGGKASSFERGGINALHFYNPRFYNGSATIGFRCSYVDL